MNIKTTLNESELRMLGLKCGLEIHQQLEGKKLFCNCPTTIRDDAADFHITRYLRASAGESGEVDVAALAETKKEKYFIYEGYADTTCLVELDEEPPGPVNQDALTAAIQLAKLCNMHIVDQLRFMRKTVVNGSNTSGFQRTGLVALQGHITTPDGKTVGITSLGLEEDSCKDVDKSTTFTTYNLSRLGIPLLELATDPDISLPAEAKTVAEHIGMLMRSLPVVKRGLGTIRQDVNVSIAKGERVELKGAQDLKMLPTLLLYESLRQHNLLEIFTELKKRGAKVRKDFQQVTSLDNSSSNVIRLALAKPDGVVYATALEGFAGLVGVETQPGRRYGSELSDYAKVMGVQGLFHSDELPNYGITQVEKDALFKELSLDSKKDAFILIADSKLVAQRAILFASERAADFNLRKEVRMAKPDGTSVYMRPMPGASRMYPETDVKPILLAVDAVSVPELLTDKIKKLVAQFGIAEAIAKRLLKDGIDLFSLTKQYPNIKPSYFIDYYYSLPKQIEKEVGRPFVVDDFAKEHFSLLDAGAITPEGIILACSDLAKGKKIDYANYAPVSLDEVKADIAQTVHAMKNAPVGAIIGKLMSTYKGKIDGKTLSAYVRELLDT
jgi:glutamyl-tRNA(Gln) amidotransferase subunit E